MEHQSVPVALSSTLRHELLSAQEEARIAVKARKGDEAAIGRLVACNARLAYSMAQRFARRYEDVPDLYSAALEGLAQAARRFDPRKFRNRQARFATYAAWYIRRQMQVHSADSVSNGFVLSYANACLLARIRSFRALFFEEHGQEASAHVVAAALKISEAKARRLMSVASTTSLDAPIDAHGDLAPLHSMVPTDAPTAADIADDDSRLALLREAIGHLSAIERDVLTRRFGIDGRSAETLESVARSHKVTRERVRQIEARALRLLRISAGRKTSRYAELAA